MFYLTSPSALPLCHISSGQLLNSGGFIHPDRTIDTFVIIVCAKGELHIEQDGREFNIGENQFILLFPGVRHRGVNPSKRPLTYTWCHFQIQQNNYQLVGREAVDSQIHLIRDSEIPAGHYIIPETGALNHSERIHLIFRQLLDAAERKNYPEHYANYALSLLAMEISMDFLSGYNMLPMNSASRNIAEIIEWIRINHSNNLSVTGVANQFSYTPNYISNAFKKHTGSSLLGYINRTKINAAKRWLLNSNASIKTVASVSGFKDDKHFMKVFKRLEGITPSQYRGAFYLKHMNKQ